MKWPKSRFIEFFSRFLGWEVALTTSIWIRGKIRGLVPPISGENAFHPVNYGLKKILDPPLTTALPLIILFQWAFLNERSEVKKSHIESIYPRRGYNLLLLYLDIYYYLDKCEKNDLSEVS